MPTIKQVAALANVSSATVSHVINGTRYVSEAVRGRVVNAMNALDYRPNALARSLRSGQTHTLGLILPDSANAFFSEVGRSIEGAAFSIGYSVILCNTDNDQNKERLYTEVLENKQVDGIIFVGAGENRQSISTIVKNGLPLVIVDRDMGDLQLDRVTIDNYSGGELAVQHLLAQGHKVIGCITGPSNLTPSAERVIGYRYALSRAGIDVDESLMARGDFQSPSGHVAAMRLLKRPSRPSALFVCNDMMAIGALRAVAQLGLNVPGDVAIVGFDDIELASYTTPSLSTVAQPKQEIGRMAIKLISERLQNPELPPRRIILPTQLVIRESSTRS